MNVAAFVCAAGMSGTENEIILLVLFLSFNLIAWTYWLKHQQLANDQYRTLAISHLQRLPYLLQSPFYMCQPMNRGFHQFFLAFFHIYVSWFHLMLYTGCVSLYAAFPIQFRAKCVLFTIWKRTWIQFAVVTLKTWWFAQFMCLKYDFIIELISTFWYFFCNKRKLASFTPAIRLLRSSGCSK